MSDTDAQLIERFKGEGDNEAFTEIVRRHLGLVYSAALRQVRIPQLAEEIAQSVFIDLVRGINELKPGTVLAAWLYSVTRRTVVDVLRREARRQQREQTAAELISMNTSDDDWEQVWPMLDEAMESLNETDRSAVLLRYFDKRSLREVGATLGVSDDAAQKRVSRAVDQLRSFFSRRGVTIGAGALVAALFEHAANAAPVSLVASVSAGAMAGKLAVPSGQSFGITWKGAAVGAGALLIVAIITALSLRDLSAKDRSEAVDVALNTASAAAEGQVDGSMTNEAPEKAAVKSSAADYLLRFRVVSASTGLGIERARIVVAHFYAGGRGERSELVTDSEGWAPIPKRKDGVPSACNVFTSVEGYVPKAITIEEKPPEEYVLMLDAAVMAAGVVVDDEGVPVSGVRLEAERDDHDRYKDGEPNTDFQTFRVETDRLGGWSYPYIPADYREVRFILWREGYVVVDRVLPMGGAAATNARFVISRGGSIVGRVVDPDGFPVVGATVFEEHSWRNPKTRTGGTGLFALSGVFTNYDDANHHEAKLTVQANGFAAQIRSVPLLEPTNHVLIKMSRGRIFQGRVLDQEGNPVVGAVVRTDYDDARQIPAPFEWRTEVNANGWFQWDSAPEETICYWIGAPGYEAISSKRFAADGAEHRIVLKKKTGN